MINLLPQETNTPTATRLPTLSYCAGASLFSLGLIGAGLIATYGLLSVQHAVSTTNQQIIDTNIALSNAKQAETTKKLATLATASN